MVFARSMLMAIRFLGFAPRVREEVPLGIESALPEFPAPSRAAQRQPRMGWPSRLLLGVAAVLVLLGVWRLGQGLYTHIKAQFAQVLAIQTGTPATREDGRTRLTPISPYPAEAQRPRSPLRRAAPASKG